MTNVRKGQAPEMISRVEFHRRFADRAFDGARRHAIMFGAV